MSLQSFSFEGAQVRTVTVDGAPWWVAADVAAVLELGNLHSSLAQLDQDERSLHTVESGQRSMSVISEPGLYSLILRSRKPQARAFKRWITHEVIPAIRRTGRYEVQRPEPSKLELARDLVAALEAREAAEQRAAALEPSARAWDTLADATGDYSLRDAALILNRDPGISTGQNRLLASLRDLGMVDRRGTPYARHAAHLRERPTSYRHPHTGDPMLGRPQIRVTVRGLRYLHQRMGGVAPLRFEQVAFDHA